MVLGVIAAVAAGVGALAGGFGVFKGASRAGKAAQRVAANADRFLASIAGDVKEVKTLLIFATKALTVLILLCIVLVCNYIPTTSPMPTRDRRRHSVIFQYFAVQFVSWMCLLMACVLVCSLIIEIKQITSPGSIVFIFVIPPLVDGLSSIHQAYCESLFQASQCNLLLYNRFSCGPV